MKRRSPTVGQLLGMYAGSLGRKRGTDALLSVLLNLNDLSGEWRMTHERAFRTGAGRDRTPEIQRARAIGSITARRAFTGSSGQRSIAASIALYASPSDAVLSAETIVSRLIRQPFSDVRASQSRNLDVGELGVKGLVVAYEESFIRLGKNGRVNLLSGAVDRAAWSIDFSALEDTWNWGEMLPIATRQIEKIHSLNEQQ